MKAFLRCLPFLALAAPAGAVPSFLQMYKIQYGVPVASCMLCHMDHAGGKLNDYGHDFLKAGASFEAFAAIEGKDSDGDGTDNLAEIRAGSNPGDPASTPARPGSWLADADPRDAMPLKSLVHLFPGIKKFEVREVTLTDEDAKALADALGAPLGKTDRYWTFYFPVDERATPPQRIGVAVFPAASLEEGLFLGGLAFGPDGVIRAASAEITSELGGDDLKPLARQLVGKSASDPLALGKDLKPVTGLKRASADGARELRKAVLVVARVLGAS